MRAGCCFFFPALFTVGSLASGEYLAHTTVGLMLSKCLVNESNMYLIGSVITP